MNGSLSIVDAKGVILDAAPLLAAAVPRKKFDSDPLMKGQLGLHQGIVGGEDDMDRARQMVVEAHSPYAALSIVTLPNDSSAETITLADNRDLSIFSYQLLHPYSLPTQEELFKDAQRRGHIHGMLIRAALCIDAAKGPKKGKVVKSSPELEKRTQSLLECVRVAEEAMTGLASEETMRLPGATRSGFS